MGEGGGGYRRPSEALGSVGRFCASPRRSSKVWGLQPGVSGPLVAQGTATCLQKAQSSGEHMQLKVFCCCCCPFSRQKIKRAKSTRTFYCYFFLAFPRFAAPRSLRLGRAKGQTGPVSPEPEKGLNCLFKRCWETHKKITQTWRMRAASFVSVNLGVMFSCQGMQPPLTEGQNSS